MSSGPYAVLEYNSAGADASFSCFNHQNYYNLLWSSSHGQGTHCAVVAKCWSHTFCHTVVPFGNLLCGITNMRGKSVQRSRALPASGIERLRTLPASGIESTGSCWAIADCPSVILVDSIVCVLLAKDTQALTLLFHCPGSLHRKSWRFHRRHDSNVDVRCIWEWVTSQFENPLSSCRHCSTGTSCCLHVSKQVPFMCLHKLQIVHSKCW